MSTQVFLHPLVVMSIADHHARNLAETGVSPKNARVLGAVFGTQSGGTIEILSSIDLPYRLDEEKQLRIDEDAFTEDTDLHKQIYPQHECLGWYSTSAALQDTDLPFHKRFTEYNESPLYIRMNPNPKRSDKALPVSIYRMEVKATTMAGGGGGDGDGSKSATSAGGAATTTSTEEFLEVAFKVVSVPSERVATDHVLREEEIATKGSVIVPEFKEIRRSLLALHSRVKLLFDYLGAVENGVVKADPRIMQQIQSVISRLPTMTSGRYDDEFISELSNGMAMTFMASMAKLADKVNQSLDLSDYVGEGGGVRGGGMGGGRAFRAMRRFG